MMNLVATGDLEFALDFAAKIGNESVRASALATIAVKAADQTDVERARTLLTRTAAQSGTLGTDAAVARVLAACADALARLGDADASQDLAVRSLELTNSVTDISMKARILIVLTNAAARNGYGTAARQRLDSAIDWAQRVSDHEARALLFARLAAIAAALDDARTARRLSNQALDSGLQISDDLPQTVALRAVAQSAGALGKSGLGRDALADIVSATERIASDLGKARTLAYAANAATLLGDAEQTRAILGAVHQAAQKIPTEFTKVRWLLLPLVEADTKIGNDGAAAELVEHAVQVVDFVEGDTPRSLVMERTATTSSKLKSSARAADLLMQVLQNMHKVSDPSLYPRVLLSAAQATSLLGDDGLVVLEKIVTLSDSAQGEPGLAALYLALSETASKLGVPERIPALLDKAAIATEGIRVVELRARAKASLAETALKLDVRTAAEAALTAIVDLLRGDDAMLVPDAELQRAALTAAAMEQWSRAAELAARLRSDSAQLDTLTRMYAVRSRQVQMH
jgi:tetratricopeptide (TPR) repeat protein